MSKRGAAPGEGGEVLAMTCRCQSVVRRPVEVVKCFSTVRASSSCAPFTSLTPAKSGASEESHILYHGSIILKVDIFVLAILLFDSDVHHVP